MKYPICPDCALRDSDTCDFCEDADQFEPNDGVEPDDSVSDVSSYIPIYALAA